MQNTRHVLRTCVIFFTLILVLLVFAVKLVLIQVFQSSHLADLAEKQHNHLVELEPIRGSIYDRNLRPLALNIPAYSLFANPRIMSEEDKRKAVKDLSELLDLDEQFVEERLSKNKYFVWLKRKLPAELVEQIEARKLKGLDFINESKRYYPNGQLAAHIIGFAGMDNEGLEGVELLYNRYLKGKAGGALILRDARQTELMLEKNYISPQDGLHLVLTIDETIQYIAERALEKAVQKHNAKAGTVIVLDTRTGEVLALANQPTYHLEHVSKSDIESRTNRALSFVYEPGSVFKIITAAAALEEEQFIESDKIFCENGSYRVSRHILTDHRPHGTLTFNEVFQVSSNIGVVKIAEKLGPEIIYKYGQRFRFGQKTGIDLTGEVAGWLKDPSQWSKTTIGAIPIGYEVTTTPLQLVAAISTIANDGIYLRPFVVKYIKDSHGEVIKSFEPKVVDRVISPDTSRRVREILSNVVEEGTGKRARIKGMKVAGKTGTAHKVINGAYARNKYYATFMGFAPADHPRLAAIVVLDEPHPAYFGGTVSAPVFKEVIENSLKYLESSPRNNENLLWGSAPLVALRDAP